MGNSIRQDKLFKIRELVARGYQFPNILTRVLIKLFLMALTAFEEKEVQYMTLFLIHLDTSQQRSRKLLRF